MDFDTGELDTQQLYKLLTGLVVPRPIALVTSVDPAGTVNCAPFSFFNAVAHDPPLVVLGLQARPGRVLKDTAENIRRTGEFTVNVVDETIAEAMNVCAIDFEAGTEEMAEAGLTPASGRTVAVPRVAEAPAALECTRYVTLELGEARNVVLGRVTAIHVRDGCLDPDSLRVDPEALNAVGRMAGADYATTRQRFAMPRIDLADWRARTPGAS